MQICSGLSCFNHAFKRFWGQSYCGAVRQLKRHCKLPCLWCRCISSTKHLAVCKLEGHSHSHWWCSQKLPVFERPNYYIILISTFHFPTWKVKLDGKEHTALRGGHTPPPAAPPEPESFDSAYAWHVVKELAKSWGRISVDLGWRRQTLAPYQSLYKVAMESTIQKNTAFVRKKQLRALHQVYWNGVIFLRF